LQLSIPVVSRRRFALAQPGGGLQSAERWSESDPVSPVALPALQLCAGVGVGVGARRARAAIVAAGTFASRRSPVLHILHTRRASRC